MSDFINTVFYLPIEKLTLFLYQLLGNNFGLAVVALTIIIRLVLTPLTLPALKSSQKMQDMKEELDKLKERYKGNKARLQEEQLKLYKKHGINPFSGCLPLLLQIPILIVLWRVLTNLLSQGNLDAQFLWLDLSQPDPYYILPISAGIFQFIQSKMMLKKNQKKSEKKDDSERKKKAEKTEDFGESFSQAFQTQNLYFMPILWAIMLLKLPSGLGLYMVISILFGVVQQFFLLRGKGNKEKVIIEEK